MKEAHGWQNVPGQKIIVKICSPTTQNRVQKRLFKFPHRFALNIREKTQEESLEDTKTVKSSSVDDLRKC